MRAVDVNEEYVFILNNYLEELMRDPVRPNAVVNEPEEPENVANIPREDNDNPINDEEVAPPPLVVGEPQRQGAAMVAAPPLLEDDENEEVDNRFIICRMCLVNRARIVFITCQHIVFCIGCHAGYTTEREPGDDPLCPVCSIACGDWSKVIY